MKSIYKVLAAVLLLAVMLFNVASCSLFTPQDSDQQQGSADKTFYISSLSNIELKVGDALELKIVRGPGLVGDVVWTSDSSCVSVEGGRVTALKEGVAIVNASLDGQTDRVIITVVTSSGENDIGNDGEKGGNEIIIPDSEDPVTSDPYVNVDADEFYENYTPAISYMDAYYRTKHNLMSGNIDDQDQEPTISDYQPVSDGKLIRNSTYLFSEDGNTYYVVDCYGEIAFAVYKGGAYIMLEEVAAYVFAFGEPPANHSASKKTSPSSSAWGEYLRVNNTKFSGSTSKYPYEPMLPRISGCGGDLTYYEMDIGTTGTDCDPDYNIQIYNNGYSITRGAARLVYSCYDANYNKIIDLDERYVFYTYNHYNDFQEYLNYEGGWGEIFGNITGGGTLSSKYNYNPTPYAEVVRESLTGDLSITVIYYYISKNKYAF